MEVIYNLITLMEDEVINIEPSIPIEKEQLWTAKVTEGSRATVLETERQANWLDAKGTPFSTYNTYTQKRATRTIEIRTTRL
jgi:hypothetical protein